MTIRKGRKLKKGREVSAGWKDSKAENRALRADRYNLLKARDAPAKWTIANYVFKAGLSSGRDHARGMFSSKSGRGYARSVTQYCLQDCASFGVRIKIVLLIGRTSKFEYHGLAKKSQKTGISIKLHLQM